MPTSTSPARLRRRSPRPSRSRSPTEVDEPTDEHPVVPAPVPVDEEASFHPVELEPEAVLEPERRRAVPERRRAGVRRRARAAPGSSPPNVPPLEAILPPAEGYREVGYDTVARASVTGGEFQPYPELGLQSDEYAKIRQILGRRPTESELAMYSVMWSEHCSYKSSKVHLRQFTEKAPPSQRMLAGIGANAGVIKVSDKLAVTFKVESHNHPSFVEPHQGAATGVGGIVRDILAMGARPIAVMDPLRFGAPITRTPGGCCRASSAESAATATASACPTSAARSSSTRATRATRW